MRLRVPLVALALISPQIRPAMAQSDRFLKLVESVRSEYNLPAVGAAVFTTQETIALHVAGVRRAGDRTPASPADRFHIGSNTKAMTAGLLGLLVDRGKLEWSSTLGELFPELGAAMRPEYRDISVRELLMHRTGLLPNPTIDFDDGSPRAQREAFMRWIVRQPLSTKRGEFAYANSNYIIAGAIAEKVLNAEFEKALVTELLAPLGISSAGFGAPGRVSPADEPHPHRRGWFGIARPVDPGPAADNPPVFSPAGRLHIALDDYVRWGQEVMRAARGEKSIWSVATGRALVTPLAGDTGDSPYALGWGVSKRSWAGPTQRALSHAGSNTMNYTVAWLATDASFGLVVATNIGGDNAANAADDIAASIIRIYRPAR